MFQLRITYQVWALSLMGFIWIKKDNLKLLILLDTGMTGAHHWTLLVWYWG